VEECWIDVVGLIYYHDLGHRHLWPPQTVRQILSVERGRLSQRHAFFSMAHNSSSPSWEHLGSRNLREQSRLPPIPFTCPLADHHREEGDRFLDKENSAAAILFAPDNMRNAHMGSELSITLKSFHPRCLVPYNEAERLRA